VHDGGWRVESADDALQATVLVLTCPVPQSLALLDAGAVTLSATDRAALTDVAYDPCVVVLATVDRTAVSRNPTEWSDPDGEIVTRVVDQHAGGTSAVPAVVIHASPTYTTEHWSSPDERVIDDLVAAAGQLTGRTDRVTSAQVHRWRYARAVRRHPEPMLRVGGAPALLLAGDGFGAGDVEGAAASGRTAASAAAELLRGIPSTR
jgi:hypothetical protein